MKKLILLPIAATLFLSSSFKAENNVKIESAKTLIIKNELPKKPVNQPKNTGEINPFNQPKIDREKKPTKTVSYNITINAPIETVWKVLTDTDKYSEWNPFVKNVEMRNGKLAVGNEMLFTVKFQNGNHTKTREKIVVMDAPQNGHALWRYRFVGFLYDIGMMTPIRTQELFSESPNVTRVESREDFSGWGSFLVPFNQVQIGFKDQAEALKKRCEVGE